MAAAALLTLYHHDGGVDGLGQHTRAGSIGHEWYIIRGTYFTRSEENNLSGPVSLESLEASSSSLTYRIPRPAPECVIIPEPLVKCAQARVIVVYELLEYALAAVFRKWGVCVCLDGRNEFPEKSRGKAMDDRRAKGKAQ